MSVHQTFSGVECERCKQADRELTAVQLSVSWGKMQRWGRKVRFVCWTCRSFLCRFRNAPVDEASKQWALKLERRSVRNARKPIL